VVDTMALENPYDEINYADLEDLRYISRGNFGQIYRASYFGTDVAVKQLLDIGNQLMHKYIEREMSLLMYVAPPLVSDVVRHHHKPSCHQNAILLVCTINVPY
jgi:hypothetical protein